MESSPKTRTALASGPDLVFLSRDGRIRTGGLGGPKAVKAVLYRSIRTKQVRMRDTLYPARCNARVVEAHIPARVYQEVRPAATRHP